MTSAERRRIMGMAFDGRTWKEISAATGYGESYLCNVFGKAIGRNNCCPEKWTVPKELADWVTSRPMTKSEAAEMLGLTPDRFTSLTNRGRNMTVGEAYKVSQITGIPIEVFADYYG